MSAVDANEPNVDPWVSGKRQRTCRLPTVREEIGDATARVPLRSAFGCRQSAAAAGEAQTTSVATVPATWSFTGAGRADGLEDGERSAIFAVDRVLVLAARIEVRTELGVPARCH